MFAFVFIAFLNPIVLVYDLWNSSLEWVHKNYFSVYKNRLENACPNLGTLPRNEALEKATSDNDPTRIYVENPDGSMRHFYKEFATDALRIETLHKLNLFLKEYKWVCGLDRPPYYEEIEYIKNARANGTELPKALE